MTEDLEKALRAVPVARLEAFGRFCARQWKAGSPPGVGFWHALACLTDEVLTEARDEIEHLDRLLDDEDGIGAIMPGV